MKMFRTKRFKHRCKNNVTVDFNKSGFSTFFLQQEERFISRVFVGNLIPFQLKLCIKLVEEIISKFKVGNG